MGIQLMGQKIEVPHLPLTTRNTRHSPHATLKGILPENKVGRTGANM